MRSETGAADCRSRFGLEADTAVWPVPFGSPHQEIIAEIWDMENRMFYNRGRS